MKPYQIFEIGLGKTRKIKVRTIHTRLRDKPVTVYNAKDSNYQCSTDNLSVTLETVTKKVLAENLTDGSNEKAPEISEA